MSELLLLSSSSSTSSTNGTPNEVMAVAERSLSPENRLSNVHSRNSSKTLKCPKCNWHYKYQETLEIHMKEKHQMGTNSDGNLNNSSEIETNCSYCLSNSVHPRLARGEQYPCGFKPYRCELCLYSTTTKGNLAIHMQSDKHMNNFRDLSSPNIQQPSTSSTCTSSPDNSLLDQTSLSQEMKVATESSSSIETFTCPLCSQTNLNTKESLKEHLCSIHNCTRDALNRCLALIEDSGLSSMAETNDEYRCHLCPNKTFKDFYLLLNHIQDQNHSDEEDKTVGLLCWKKGCNQYFNSLSILEKHFHEIHSINNLIESNRILEPKTSSSSSSNVTPSSSSSNNFLSKSRERLISIGEDLVLHYLENHEINDDNSSNEILCDLCLKKFSSLSTLKVHYEDIHSIVLSSRAIQHWIFLLQKLHSSSSSSSSSSANNKLKRQSSSSLQNDFNQNKKSRYENLLSPSYLIYPPSSSSSAAAAASLVNQYDLSNNKRQRTRITDEQLRILRAHFNINNSPSDEQILLMSQKSQLTTKVIKHWFRNTLFKERQRNKDSPYNFSNPPSTSNQIDLDEYQKTGTIIKRTTNDSDYSDNDLTSNDEQDLLSDIEDLNLDYNNKLNNQSSLTSSSSQQQQHQHHQQQQQQQQQQHQSSSSSSSRRANRTRFSDQQLRLLQDAFEANPYPKDDDLEILSQKLKLNSRVIVVWFQNARQKARKSYENNQNDTNNNHQDPSQQQQQQSQQSQSQQQQEEEQQQQQQEQLIKSDKDEGYSCKNCQKLFSRFAELMKHAKQCSPLTTKKSSLSNKKDFIKAESIEQNPSSIDSLSSYQMLVAAASLAAAQQQQTPSTQQQQQQQQQQYTIPSSFSRKDNYCDQCDKTFTSTTEFNEHQTLHMQALINAAAFFPLAAYHPAAAAAAAAMAALSSQLFTNTPTTNLSGVSTPSTPTTSSVTLHASSNELAKASVSSYASDSSNEIEEEDGGASIDSNDENHKLSNVNNQKRNRTTILPEQQDYLMSKYSIESNPSRKMLEDISSEVKLKKRVVQVWFQNTRARERKGNIKIESNSNSTILNNNNLNFNKKCLHCSLTFKLKSTLENHLLTKHSDFYKTKDDLNLIDYDLFPCGISLNDDLPLDLSSKTSIKLEKKCENEDFINEWNDSSDQSNDSNENFKFNLNNKISQKILSNGHLSPTGSIQSSSNGINGQRRFRTQMTPLQIKLMKAIFLEYRTPTMPECELLGKEIELQKRVVQVWFQNARAKEKKNPNFFKSDLPEEFQPTNDQCKLCQCKYTLQNPQRDHLFTTKHIENIRLILTKQMGNVSTIKDDNQIKKNSINMKLDLENCPTSVLDKSSKDEQNQIMSYLNLMHLMPLGMDPYNYGLMDPNIHGTPMFMLQLPSEALNKIVSLSKSDTHLTRAQYTQDGKTLQNLIDNGHTSVDYQTVDVGYACKRCNLVWPLYESCRCHALLCWQISPSTLPICINSREDLNNLSGYIFKIEQLTYRCLLCKTSCSTICEYEKHIKDDIHLKKKRSNSTIEEND
ncbi:unnamed protein product [Adineta steineri]|uniref:Uncharacterized protein n=1 Tax=Adineta steineri TaxID=433720 RepID=A0A814HPI1_9BILA|nr:unnamed protein product [Adineta steineri]CAF1051547.1 unnamed protein product [Adineta steineri]